MDFTNCLKQHRSILMEGALGERLKREYGLKFDENLAMAKLIYEEKGATALRNLWSEYIEIAKKYHLPFMATTPTRRVNLERVGKAHESEKIILDNVDFLKNIQRTCGIEMYVGALLGCKGDAYTGEGALSEKEAYEFHSWSAQYFKKANVDFLYAAIMPTLPEAAGMAKVLEETKIPYIISFTIKKDGRLVDGTPIIEAIQYIDSVTEFSPICYMTNCVHPSIVLEALNCPFNNNSIVKERFMGIQANTSPLSYEELDNSIDLKCSEPKEFADEMMKLYELGNFKIFGGCCGTDNRHMECVAERIFKKTKKRLQI